MPLMIILLNAASWCLAVVVFEFGYHAVAAHAGFDRKGLICKLWWILLSVIVLSLGPKGVLLQLIMLFILGVSHIHLAYQQDEVITLTQVFRNIPTALRDWADRIRPFLK